MGRDSESFRTLTLAIVERHAGPLAPDRISERTSSKGRFLRSPTRYAPRAARSSTASTRTSPTAASCSSRFEQAASASAPAPAPEPVPVESEGGDRERREHLCRAGDVRARAFGRELGHREARHAAGVDAAERLEVHVDVEREPMVAAAAPDAQADACELALPDVDARRRRGGRRRRCRAARRARRRRSRARPRARARRCEGGARSTSAYITSWPGPW